VLDDLTRQLGVAPGEVTPDMEYSVDTVRCVGACSFAPVVAVGDQTYGDVTPKKVSQILKNNGAA
jgi:NADH:ubiquinone oxidoreductase subunit E